jgi:hypothetical protein
MGNINKRTNLNQEFMKVISDSPNKIVVESLPHDTIKKLRELTGGIPESEDTPKPEEKEDGNTKK